MLVLEPKRNEKIKLTDGVSGAVVTVKSFIRDSGKYCSGFRCPEDDYNNTRAMERKR